MALFGGWSEFDPLPDSCARPKGTNRADVHRVADGDGHAHSLHASRNERHRHDRQRDHPVSADVGGVVHRGLHLHPDGRADVLRGRIHCRDLRRSGKLEPITAGTRVTLTIRYRRLLDPAWYFKPAERYGVRKAGQYFLDQIYQTP